MAKEQPRQPTANGCAGRGTPAARAGGGLASAGCTDSCVGLPTVLACIVPAARNNVARGPCCCWLHWRWRSFLTKQHMGGGGGCENGTL